MIVLEKELMEPIEGMWGKSKSTFPSYPQVSRSQGTQGSINSEEANKFTQTEEAKKQTKQERATASPAPKSSPRSDSVFTCNVYLYDDEFVSRCYLKGGAVCIIRKRLLFL